MKIRMDKFQVGDVLTWLHEPPQKERFADKVTVVAVHDVKLQTYDPDEPGVNSSNWEDMGHTQHIMVNDLDGSLSSFSGYWFHPVR